MHDITDAQLRNWFTYRPPGDEDRTQYENIREAAYVFARTILRNTPVSPDQTVAIRTIREAVFWANSAIACDEAR